MKTAKIGYTLCGTPYYTSQRRKDASTCEVVKTSRPELKIMYMGPMKNEVLPVIRRKLKKAKKIIKKQKKIIKKQKKMLAKKIKK